MQNVVVDGGAGTLKGSSLPESLLWQSPWVTARPFSFANRARQWCTASMHMHRVLCKRWAASEAMLHPYVNKIRMCTSGGCNTTSPKMQECQARNDDTARIRVGKCVLPQDFVFVRVIVICSANETKMLLLQAALLPSQELQSAGACTSHSDFLSLGSRAGSSLSECRPNAVSFSSSCPSHRAFSWAG